MHRRYKCHGNFALEKDIKYVSSDHAATAGDKCTLSEQFLKKLGICEECYKAKVETHCLNCNIKFCFDCFENVHTPRTMRKHISEVIANLTEIPFKIPSCNEHNIKCEHICLTCYGGKGSEVNTKQLTNADELSRDARTGIESMFNAKKLLGKHIAGIIEHGHAIDKQVSSFFYDLHELLKEREAKLKEQLAKFSKLKLQQVIALDNDIQNEIVYFEELLEIIENEEECYNISQVINEINNASEKITPLMKSVYSDSNLDFIKLHLDKRIECTLQNSIDISLEASQQLSETADQNIVLSSLSENAFVTSDADEENFKTDDDDIVERESLNLEFDDEKSLLRIGDTSITMENVEVSETLIKGCTSVDQLECPQVPLVVPISPTKDGISNFISRSDIQKLDESKCSVYQVAPEIPKPKNIILLHLEDNIEITQVDSPSLFYVQRNADKKSILKLQEVINRQHKLFPCLQSVIKGSLYISQYTIDDNWYRAIVIDYEQDKDICAVKYIDYGNSEVILCNRLRECPSHLNLDTIPAFGLSCALHNIEPCEGRWKPESVTIFCELVKNIEVHMFVFEVNPVSTSEPRCKVDIRRPCQDANAGDYPAVSLREVLLFLELGKSSDENFYRPEILLDELTSVTLLEFKSPDLFYLQLQSKEDHLEKLNKSMIQHYTPRLNLSYDWKMYAPKVGMICAVVKKVNGNIRWCRAIIEDLPGNRNVTVFLVDYGISVTVEFFHIRKVKEEFCKIPYQAVKCKMANIAQIPESCEWPDDVKDVFTELKEKKTQYKALFHTVKDEQYEISLYCYDEDSEDYYDIGSSLVSRGLAHSTSTAKSNTSDSYSFDKFFDGSMKKSRLLYTGRRFLLNGENQKENDEVISTREKNITQNFISVEFLILKTPEHIHVRLKSRNENFLKIQDDLYKYRNGAAKLRSCSPVLGEIYCVSVKKYPFCLRVKVVKNSDLDKVVVYYIDVGGFDDLKSDEVYVLPEELKSQPQLAFIVALCGIKPAGDCSKWSGIATDFITSELNAASNICIVRKGKAYKDLNMDIKVAPVEIGWFKAKSDEDFQNGIDKEYVSLNEMLINLGFALPERFCSDGTEYEAPISDILESTRSDVSTTSEVLSMKELEKERPFPIPDLKDWDASQEEPPSKLIKQKYQGPPSPHSKIFTAIPTNVDMSGNIYLHPISYNDGLQEVRNIHTRFYDESFPSNDDLEINPGDALVAKFHIDKLWYRASAIEVLQNKVKVFFVDYGNTDWVLKDDCRTYILDNRRIMCYKCKLYGIVPKSSKWLVEDLDLLHDKLVDKLCEATIVEYDSKEDIYMIKLVLIEQNESIEEFLVHKMELCHYIFEDSSNKNMLSSASYEAICVEHFLYTNSLPLPYHKLPAQGLTNMPVNFASCIDPICFYLCPKVFSKYNSPYFEVQKENRIKLKSYLDEARNNLTFYPVVLHPLQDTVYIAQFPGIKNTWGRVTVLNVHLSSAVVLFIDMGAKVENIDVNLIREAPLFCKDIPPLGFMAKLRNLKNPDGELSSWLSKTKEKIEEILLNSEDDFYADIYVAEGEIPTVEVYTNKCGKRKLAYEELINTKELMLS